MHLDLELKIDVKIEGLSVKGRSFIKVSSFNRNRSKSKTNFQIKSKLRNIKLYYCKKQSHYIKNYFRMKKYER